MRGVTGLIAGLLSAWVALAEMHEEIHYMQLEIETQTVAIQHTNSRIDALQLDMLMRQREARQNGRMQARQYGDPP